MFKYLGDGHASIQQLLSSLIRNGRHERSRTTDQAKFAGPRVVHGNGRRGHLGSRDDGTRFDKILVSSLDHVAQLVKRGRNDSTGLLESLVLGNGGFALGVC